MEMGSGNETWGLAGQGTEEKRGASKGCGKDSEKLWHSDKEQGVEMEGEMS